jgi:hypothetical protein
MEGEYRLTTDYLPHRQVMERQRHRENLAYISEQPKLVHDRTLDDGEPLLLAVDLRLDAVG